MQDQLIATRDPHCVEEILEGEIVLYGAGSAKAFYLNESAALVWQLIDDKRSVGEIRTLLADAYPEAATLDDDITATLQALREHGVVHLS